MSAKPTTAAWAVLLVSGVVLLAPVATAQTGPQIRAVDRIVRGASLVDRFDRPMGLAADPARGILVVADAGRHRLVLLDRTGRSRGCIPCDAGPRDACEPSAVALDARGRIYVVDALRRDLEVLTSTGSRLARFDPAPAEGGDIRPQGIAVGTSGRIYVVYSGERPGLLAVEPKGPTVLKVGFTPDTPFRGPVAVAVNPDESVIAVVDPAAERAVLLFGPDGQLRTAFGGHGEGEGTFSMAAHATWGPRNTLWITDEIRHSVSVFDHGGTFLGRIGGFGAGPGQFDYPAGCAFLAFDRVAVLERAGARLQVLEVDGGTAWETQTGLGSFGPGSTGTFSSAEVR